MLLMWSNKKKFWQELIAYFRIENDAFKNCLLPQERVYGAIA
jgi:hypothetical protein